MEGGRVGWFVSGVRQQPGREVGIYALFFAAAAAVAAAATAGNRNFG